MKSPYLHLVIVEPDGRERTYPLVRKVLVGRGPDAELRLETEGISRHHCTLEPRPGGAILIDLGSTNGSFVNGTRIEEAQLRAGDTIVLGRQVLKIVEGTPATAAGRETLCLGATSIQHAIKAAALPYPPPQIKSLRAPVYLAALYRIIQAINTHCGNTAKLYPETLEAMMDALGMDLGVLFLAPAAGRPLQPVEVIDRAKVPGYEPSATVLTRVMRQAEAVIATDVGQSSELGKVASLAGVGVTRIFAAPLIEGENPCGAVYLSARGRREPEERPGNRQGDRHGASSESVEEDFTFFTAAIRQLAMAGLNSRERWRIEQERDLLREAEAAGACPRLVGSSAKIRELRELVQRAARFETTVLIVGETGTGKELVARGIHAASGRGGLFVPVNCGAIPGSMMESELFGHEKGAFTGAYERKIGKIELAQGGTLFLDEVAELSLELQVKLLRVLEDRTFYRVGGTEEVHVDVRFMAATHQDLVQRAKDGLFREDLLFRLRVLEMRVPPLLDHLEDLEELTSHLLERLARQMNRKAPRLSGASLEKLRQHSWPGNVRELRNVLERALILLDGDTIEPGLLSLGAPAPGPTAPFSPQTSLRDVERAHIRRVLEATGWNKTAAAEILGIGRPTIYEKIKAYGLEPSS
ncbi:MAG: sigma 54-interacting transcriptional regulator [Planctomycetota bacterium]